ncbi:UNVERIFIED_CONTAM: hypothetical protein MT382_00470 [Aeromonas salmonicida]
MLLEQSCDFLGICEVSSNDVKHLAEQIDSESFSIIDLTQAAGQTRFDMAVIYNKSKIKAELYRSIFNFKMGNVVKAAQAVDIVTLNNDKYIRVYLCHWSSRLDSSGALKRCAAADQVYSSAVKLMEEGKDVIIMGDFNDNPYDESLNVRLQASRCHDAVKKYPREYFYNPFWRTVVSDLKYSHANINTEHRSGSYKYKQFLGTIWHSYDQICVSGSFLSNGSWHLNEYETKVLSYEDILEDYGDSKHFIDHLPVMCEITEA